MAPKPTYEDLQRRVTELEKPIARLRETETALRITELWQERIFNSLEEAVFVVTPDRKLINVNDGASRMFGYSREELASLSTTVLHVDQGHYVEFGKIIQEAFDRGEPANFEFEVKRKNGEIFPSEHTVTLLKGEQGEPLGIVSVVRDITERKQYERELEKRVEERTAQLKLANEELRGSEARFRQLFDEMKDGLAVYEAIDGGKDFVFRDINPAGERIGNVKKSEIIGKSLYEIRPNIDEFGLVDVLRSVWQTGKAEHHTERFYKDEKLQGWFDNYVYKLESGEVVALFADNTARRVAEAALRKSETLLNATQHLAKVGGWEWDVKSQSMFWTEETYRIHDFQRDEFEPGSSDYIELSLKCYDPEDRPIIMGAFRRCIEKGHAYDLEFPFTTATGHRRWIRTAAKPVLEGDRIVKVVGNIMDITVHKEAKKALQESEEKYRSMMEAMKDPIYICSQDYRVEYMNPAMIQRTGREATGEFCFKALHDLEEKCPWCMHEKAQQGEYSEIDIVSPKDGRFYYISCAPIVYRDGSVSRLTVWKDTTNLRTLETQLQQAQKMEAIGTLAGGIAHDFNNILGGIMGYAELAKLKALDGSNVIVDLEQLIKSSKRAADLVKQILTISRQHKQEQRPMQVRYIVNEALNLLRATLPTTIEIREDLAKDAGIVNADPTQIHQVIMNLCTNAGHAMQEDGGVLEVSLDNVELDDLSVSKHLDLNAGFYLRLTLSDTGYGMTAEIMERIFDPYFTTKDTGEGTGLGLSVAQGIVKAHGGTIAVYSELGKGTTFHVYLPLILEEEREEKESEEPLPTGTERILFIDDEQVLIDIARQMLKQLKYTVVTRQKSLQALELFRTEPDRFDLVITDMTMPHMTGDKLAREFMEIRPDIPVILCTGHSRLVSKEKAKEIGVKAFVMKPLVMRDLAETVRKVLDKK